MGSVESAAEAMIGRALSREGGYAVLCNVHVLMTARRQPELMCALEQACVVLPDGAPIAWFQRRLGARTAQRIGGPDLMSVVIDRGREHRLRHALFGSTPKVAYWLKNRLENRYPGADIVAVHAPARGNEETAMAREAVSYANPDVIWCALGAPKQELWMNRWAASLQPSFVVGVGAAFDFLAESKRRAPRWMRDSGLEWSYRLASEPRRLASRYARTNTAFTILAARSLLSRK